MIKTFKFIVSNAAYKYTRETDPEQDWYKKRVVELTTPEEIDNTIMSWIKENNVSQWSIEAITPVTFHQHNNGRCDSVELYYTIRYK